MSVLVTRPGQLDDVPWMTEQLREFASGYGTRRSLFPDDPAERENMLAALIGAHVVIVAEWVGGARDGERVGFIVGCLTPHPFNSAINTLMELWWWVVPEARGTRAGARLLDAFVAAGRERAHWITCGLVTGRTRISGRGLEKRGFHLHEFSYLLEVD